MTMASSEDWKERRDQVARYRAMEQETTDPLAAGLLRDIVSDCEAETEERPSAPCDLALEPGMIEFHGRSVWCLVRTLSESGAALDVIRPREIPDRFMLALPLGGASHRCRLIWRGDMEIGVNFQQKVPVENRTPSGFALGGLTTRVEARPDRLTSRLLRRSFRA